MRSRWFLALIGVSLFLIAWVLLGNQAWVEHFVTKYGRMYLKQVSTVYPIILGTIIASAAILLLELIVLGWEKCSLRALIRPSKSAVNDMFLWALSISQIWVILSYMITANMFIKVRPKVRDALGIEGTVFPLIENPILQLALYMLFIDFISYVFHYFMHRIPTFWHFHKVHHSATEFNGITSERAHPVETNLIAEVVFTIPFAFMGFPLMDMSVYVGARHFMAMVHHSRLEWDWGWVGKYILVSPQYHRIHHSNRPEHYNKNLAVLFSFWDHLFGTFCGDRIGLEELGVTENNYNKKHAVHDLSLAFREAWYAHLPKRLQKRD